MAVIFIPSAFAVHDTGVFQLDGNADQSVAAGYPNATEDWSAICKANPTTCTPSPGSDVSTAPSTTAEKSTFITDVFNSGTDNIFKSGTDDADVSTWLWKDATPSPNKADIEHAYAAQYKIPMNGSAEQGHQVLYFGGDRFSNSGDTNIGLWFFQKPVTDCGTTANCTFNPDGSVATSVCPVQSGCGFTGVHTAGNISLGGNKPGDLFILSSFTGGGAEPTIKIFEWVGPGNATKNYLGSNNCFTNACTLQPLAIPTTPGFSDNRCATTAEAITGDQACALVNPAAVNSPWTFQDQASHSPANVFGANEFYEGGLDLTGLGFTNVCFSSVLLNTRSSQSGTSALQDFALGNFGGCGSTLKTTPSVGAGGVNLPPTSTSNPSSVSVTDSAHLTVTGTSTFSGTLSFHLCGPTATTSTALCTTGGVDAGSITSVTANGDYTSPNPTTVTEAGRYCWRGDFTATTPTDLTGSSDSSASECFIVNPVTPTLSTTASGTVEIGNAISDTAILGGTANQPGTGGGGTDGSINTTNGALAGGSITWTAYGPNSCTTVAFGPVSRTVLGDNTYPTTSQPAVSFTPTAAGTYTWVASYSGSPNTNGVAATACANQPTTEQVVVTPKHPTISTQVNHGTSDPVAPGTPLSDTATLGNTATPSNGTNGTITFTAYGPESDTQTCPNADAVYTSTITVSGNGNYVSSNGNGGTFAPTVPGHYNWIASYTPATGDVNNLSATTACGDANEGSIVRTIPTQISTHQSWYPNDSATITSSLAGDNLGAGGTVAFALYSNSTCTGTALYTESKTLTGGSHTETVHTTNGNNPATAFSVDTAGPFYWNVTYAPTSADKSHTGIQSACVENHSYTFANDSGPGTAFP
jgi:hypothetical protein